MVYFVVSQTGSEQGESTNNFDMSMAVDRETGESVEMWDLFRCTKEELVQTILKCSKISDSVLEDVYKRQGNVRTDNDDIGRRMREYG